MPNETKSKFSEARAFIRQGEDAFEDRRGIAHELVDRADAWIVFAFYDDHSGDSTMSVSTDMLPGLLAWVETEAIPSLHQQLVILEEQVVAREKMND